MQNLIHDNRAGQRKPRPDWLKVKAPGGESFAKIKSMMRSKSLHTVCEEAHCPNIGECWSCGTATFLILGDVCSRNCRFCAINPGKAQLPDCDEPKNVAESVKRMLLKHAVITSVTRDDLPDHGSDHWAQTILEVRKINTETTIEVLIPDFKGNEAFLQKIVDAAPDIFNHNMETVPRLYDIVRPQANYQTSLDVLNFAKSKGMRTKSGIMVGLGETNEEVFQVMEDLRKIDLNILTIGQYLQPTKQHLPVERFVHPDEFKEFEQKGLQMGFEKVESAPLVRSSYHAEKHV